jgi:hypothetical protein
LVNRTIGGTASIRNTTSLSSTCIHRKTLCLNYLT